MRRYTIVATNPPYMDSRDYNPHLKSFIDANYKDANRNLYAAMMRRSLELLESEGRLAMIAGQSFMFISSFVKLREYCWQTVAIETLAQFGYGLFKARVDTAAFILRVESDQAARLNSVGVYFRVTKEPDADTKKKAFEMALERHKQRESDPHLYNYRQGDFAAIPGRPWVYWLTPSLRQIFVDFAKLEDIAQPRVGLQTEKNPRFLRCWWEVGTRQVGRGCADAGEAGTTGKRWFPYMKGGDFRRWFGNQVHVVNWKDDGAEVRAFRPASVIRNPDFYFRRGVTWTDLTAGRFSARLSPGGFIFDVAGSSVFPPDIELFLAVMNSSWAQYALKLINPTVHVQVGDLARLPVPKVSVDSLRDPVRRALSVARTESEEDETTYDFVAPPDWPDGVESVTARHEQLAKVEQQIDEEVFKLYEVSETDRKAIEDELAEVEQAPEDEHDGNAADSNPDKEADREVSLTPEDLAKQWFRYAVGIALGRLQPGVEGAIGSGRFNASIASKLRQLAFIDGLMVLEEGHPSDLAARVIEILQSIYDDAQAEGIIRAAVGDHGALRQSVREYLVGAFFKEHVKRYLKRPVYWLLQSPERKYSVYLFHEIATENTLSLLQGKKYLGGRILTLENKLQEAKEKEDKTPGSEKTYWKRTARELAELLDDLRAFDQNIAAANNFSITDRNGHPKIVRWQPEFDDGILLNAAPLHELAPSWKRADSKMDLMKAWKDLEKGEYDWAKTAMRYWPQRVFKACQKNKSFAIAHGLA
jgi:hypothetical protein